MKFSKHSYELKNHNYVFLFVFIGVGDSRHIPLLPSLL